MRPVATTRCGLALLAAITACSIAHAQRMSKADGNTLLKLCSAASPGNCDAYLAGISDSYANQGREHAGACIPIAVTGVQLRKVMVTFLRDHPQDLQRPAGELAGRAFTSVFPCH